MHGGDIYQNQVELDFSININPLGMPEEVRKGLIASIEEAERYPDIEYRELKTALSHFLNVRSQDLICGNGASELILSICHAFLPKTAMLCTPCFSGYEMALKASQTKILYLPLEEKSGFRLQKEQLSKIRDKKPDLFFLTNPNNPTGVYMRVEEIEEIAAVCEKNGTLLVLDECFIELTTRANSFLSKYRDYENVIILRAFTKSYAMPGLRLGYAIAKQELIKQMKDQLPEWNLSSLAQRAGVLALLQTEYIKRANILLETERNYVKERLQKLGFSVYDSRTCYLLIHLERREIDLYESLLQRGILIRDCQDYRGLTRGFYRIAIKLREQNERLLFEIKKILES